MYNEYRDGRIGVFCVKSMTERWGELFYLHTVTHELVRILPYFNPSTKFVNVPEMRSLYVCKFQFKILIYFVTFPTQEYSDNLLLSSNTIISMLLL